jgi:hypothetical protein
VREQRKDYEHLRLRQSSLEFDRESDERYRFHRRVLDVSTNAIGCPLETYIVIRTEAGIGAIMFTERTRSRGGPLGPDSLPNARAKYKWFYRADLSGRFTDPDTQSGDAEVFEKYKVSDLEDSNDPFVISSGVIQMDEEDPSTDEDDSGTGDRIVYVDDGSELFVRCGPIALGWSSPLYLYFPGSGPFIPMGDEPFVELAVTETDDIAKVDANDPSLIWCARKPQPVARFQYDPRWVGLINCGILFVRILATY